MSQATAGRPSAGRTGGGSVRSSRPGDRPQWSRYTQQAGLTACVLVLAAVFAGRNGTFLSAGNLIELLRSATLYFIVACAATLSSSAAASTSPSARFTHSARSSPACL
jgi:hypothetical protein